MKSVKTEDLGNGLKRETNTYNNGAQHIVTYKEGLFWRKVHSTEKREPPKPDKR